LFKEKIIIGNSNTNTKSIFLNKNIDYLEFDKNGYTDEFEYKYEDNLLTVKRIDTNTGWGQNLFCTIYFKGIKIKMLWDVFLKDDILKDNMCYVFYNDQKIMVEKNPLYPYPNI